MTTTPIIELDGVGFHHGDLPVISDISLTIEEGRFVGIIGPNGGGKTTLLRLMLGLLVPDQGEVRILGQRVTRPGQFADCVAYVPQRSEVDWTFPTRVADVVAMGSYSRVGLMKRIGAGLRKEALERLDWLGMAPLAERPIGQLSGGQQRRVFLARALMGAPRVIMLDEPCAGLDTESHRALLNQLKALQTKLGLTVVMVSHDVAEVVHFSDRIACVNRTLHWHDAPAKLKSDVLESVYACELSAYQTRHDEICHIHEH